MPQKKVISFLKFIKNQSNTNVKNLKTDNGTECVCLELDSYLKKEDVVHETTAPYCPESNGKKEREMRTIKDTARCMMHKAQGPEFLWAEAITFSGYILNRMISRQAPDDFLNETRFEPCQDFWLQRVCSNQTQTQKQKFAC